MSTQLREELVPSIRRTVDDGNIRMFYIHSWGRFGYANGINQPETFLDVENTLNGPNDPSEWALRRQPTNCTLGILACCCLSRRERTLDAFQSVRLGERIMPSIISDRRYVTFHISRCTGYLGLQTRQGAPTGPDTVLSSCNRKGENWRP